MTRWDAIAAVLLVAGVALALGAVLRRSGPGRRRCRRCDYDMRSTEGLACPECGRRARSERQLARRGVRWRLAIAAIPILAAAVALPVVGRRADRDGWTAQVPNTAVIAGSLWLDLDAANDELFRRWMAGGRPGTGTADQFARWQVAWLASASPELLRDERPLQRMLGVRALMGAHERGLSAPSEAAAPMRTLALAEPWPDLRALAWQWCVTHLPDDDLAALVGDALSPPRPPLADRLARETIDPAVVAGVNMAAAGRPGIEPTLVRLAHEAPTASGRNLCADALVRSTTARVPGPHAMAIVLESLADPSRRTTTLQMLSMVHPDALRAHDRRIREALDALPVAAPGTYERSIVDSLHERLRAVPATEAAREPAPR